MEKRRKGSDTAELLVLTLKSLEKRVERCELLIEVLSEEICLKRRRGRGNQPDILE